MNSSTDQGHVVERFGKPIGSRDDGWHGHCASTALVDDPRGVVGQSAVDAVNTFRVSAGNVASCPVVCIVKVNVATGQAYSRADSIPAAPRREGPGQGYLRSGPFLRQDCRQDARGVSGYRLLATRTGRCLGLYSDFPYVGAHPVGCQGRSAPTTRLVNVPMPSMSISM